MLTGKRPHADGFVEQGRVVPAVALEDGHGAADGADVFQWITGNQHEIGSLAFLDRPGAVGDAGNLGGERYNLTNFRFGVGRDRWRLEGFVANAFNEDYVAIAFQPNPADPTAFVGANGAPRTYGVSLRVVF